MKSPLDEPALLLQLRALEEKSNAGGNVDIRPTYGQKDDLAVAVGPGGVSTLALLNRFRSLPGVFEEDAHAPATLAPTPIARSQGSPWRGLSGRMGRHDFFRF